MARAEGGTGGSIDDIVDELQKAVRLSEVANDLQRATHAILMAHGPGAGGAPAPGGHTPTPAGRHGPEARGYDDPSKGIGQWIRGKASRMWSSSRAGRWKAGGKKIGTGVGKTLGLGKAGTGRLAAAGGAMGAVAGVVAGIVVAFVEAKKAVTKWTDEAMAAAQKLTYVSGTMAAVMAERDIQQMMRDLKKGEATAGTTRDLMESESRRKEQENRIEIAVTNASNSVLSVLNDVLADVLEPIADGVESIASAFGLGERRIEGAGLGANLSDAMVAKARIDEEGKSLMEAARRASGGMSAPAGAARPGALPFDPAPWGR